MTARVHRIDEKPRYRDPRGLTPPQDFDAERAIIGTILIDETALDRVVSILQPSDFFDEKHRLVYGACVELAQAGQPIEVTAVASRLRDSTAFLAVGGARELARMVDDSVFTSQPEIVAKRLRELGRLRTTIETLHVQLSEAYQTKPAEAQDFLERCSGAVQSCAVHPEQGDVVLLRDALADSFTRIRDRAATGNTLSGVTTGFSRLDRMLAGWQPGEVAIVAGRPGMGKTALAMQSAMRVADKCGAVLVFSLEMPRDQLVTRSICTEARVDSNKTRHGTITPNEWEYLTDAAKWMANLPLYIDDKAGLSPLDVRTKVRRLQSDLARRGQDPLVLVVIDYLQLMSGKALIGQRDSREQEVAAVSRSLKGLAKELHLPFVVLAQLNRGVEKSKDRRPQLSDLRESGSIEQDADTVVFIHREEYYLRDKTPQDQRGIAEAIIAKQRCGPTGTASLKYWSQFALFADLAAGEAPEDVGDDYA